MYRPETVTFKTRPQDHCGHFCIRMKIEDIKEGLTFDDVLLVPAYSEILPSETDTRTRFSEKY